MKSAISTGCFKVWMVIAFLVLIPFVQASSNAGNIHTKEKFAWSENTGWINMGPTKTDFPVIVHQNYLSGYAWGENIGWVKLGASDAGPYTNSSESDWGVNMASNGALTGFAWSESVGWIKFNPALSGDPVWLNKDTGIFEGYAWGENIGYIHFMGTAESGENYTLTTPRLTIDDPVVEEGSGSIKFTVTMSTTTLKDVIISYETIDGTDNASQSKASSLNDYEENIGHDRIVAGQTSQTISIPLKDDSQKEPAEYFTLHLYMATNASIQDSKGIGKILDDDGHTITLEVGEYGAITAKTGTPALGYDYTQISGYASKEIPVPHEANITIAMIPDPGKKITSVLKDNQSVSYDVNTNTFSISNIVEDYVIKVNFVDTTYSITLEQDIQHGICNISGETTNIEYNEKRTVTCTGNTNYHLTNLDICGTVISEALGKNAYEHEFSVTSDCFIQADFAIDSYSIISVVEKGDGSITPLDNYSSTHVDTQNNRHILVEHNMRPTVSISPDGYHHLTDLKLIDVHSNYTSIYSDCEFSGTTCEYKFDPVQRNYTLTAAFEGNAYTLAMLAGDGGYIRYTNDSGNWVEVHSSASIPVAYKSSRTIEIKSDDNDLHVADVSLDGRSLTRVTSSTFEYTFNDISAHHLIHARFAHILVTQSDNLGEFMDQSTAFKTIDGALEAAVTKAADLTRDPIIAVDSGNYDFVTFVKQNLTLYAIKGPETTIIDANKGSSCFIFNEISDTIVVSGFTLKNGLAPMGGGIYINNSSPTISDCQIIDNEATQYGGGIYVIIDKEPQDAIEPRLSQLYIRGNIAGEYGGGIYCDGNSGVAKPRLYQSIIRHNEAGINGGGIYVRGTGDSAQAYIRLASSWIVENQSFGDGAGIYINDGKADIFTTTISNNSFKDGYGGGIFAKITGGANAVIIEKSILWNNTREIDGDTDLIYVTYSTLETGSELFPAQNNNNAFDPKFVDPANGDYHLSAFSDVIDKGGLSIGKIDAMYQKDIDGYTRKSKAAIDIGGDEWNNLIPGVDFTVNTTSGISPLTVHFTNQTSGDTTLKIWEFGDGEVSNENNPMHIYQHPGIYTVQLTVFDSSGYSATRTRYDYITVTDSEQAVVPNFIAAPIDSVPGETTDVIGITGYMPLTVKFINTTTPYTITAPISKTTPWEWDFGTGQPVDEKSPSYIYENAGTYTVKLTVYVQGDETQEIKTKTRYGYITVLDPEPRADFEVVPDKCIKSTSNECTVTVYDRSTSRGDISKWHWDFGDNTEIMTTKKSSQTHCYTNVSSNTLTIRLTVDNSPHSKTIPIDVEDYSVTTVNAGDSIQAAIDSFGDNDKGSTIFIEAGTYIGNLDFKNKSITLKASAGDTHKVIIEPSDTSTSLIQIKEGKTVCLEGLVIQNGDADFGGGILVDNASQLILRNCILKKNDANIAGGAIAFLNKSGGVIENSTIGGTSESDKNTAPYGAGIACLYESNPMIVKSFIGKNDASINGGGIYVFAASNPAIISTTLMANYASNAKGGGIYASQSEPHITFSTIQLNRAFRGGGIYYKNANAPVITHSHIQGNTGSDSGGGIYAHETIAPQVINVLIDGNKSDTNGAGAYLNAVSSANFLFSTLANNTANAAAKGGSGCGVYGYYLSPAMTITNCILKNQGGDEVDYLHSEPPLISNTAILQTEYLGGSNVSAGPSIPLFKIYGTATPDYRLDTGSPCQDSAVENSIVLKDLNGNNRIIGNAPDMGAYESNAWPISITYNSVYGTVVDSGNATIESGTFAGVLHGGSQAFTIAPYKGYTITDFIVDNISRKNDMTIDGSTMTYTFTNVQTSHTVEAQFNRYSVTVTILYQGDTNNSTTNEVETSLTMTATTETGTEIWLLPGNNTTYLPVYHSSYLTLTAQPGIETQKPTFESAISGQAGTQFSAIITEAQEITVTALLKKFDITIIKDSDGTGTGTIKVKKDPNDPGEILASTQVKYGETLTLEANPSKSSQFSGWTIHNWNGNKQNPTISIDNITQLYDIMGRFDYKDLLVTIKREGNGGKITGTLNNKTIENLDALVREHTDGYSLPGVKYNDDLKLTAQKSNSWKFKQWDWTESDAAGITIVNYSSNNEETPFEWKAMDEDKYEISGVFTLDTRKLVIKQLPDAHGSGTVKINGTVRSLPIELTYTYDTRIEAEAIADSYSTSFLGWSNDESSANELINILMDKDKEIFVNFSLKEFAITAQSTTNGTIDPQGTTYVKFGKDQEYKLTPISNDAYLSDIIIDDQSMIDQLGRISSYTFTQVTQPHDIRAVFSQNILVGEDDSIQEKIHSSKTGDTILVSPGVYHENIDFAGKEVILKSKIPHTAILDGKHYMNTVRFVSGESSRSKLSGFVVRHGSAQKGGGIYIDNASPTIENCRIEENAAELYGGGLYIGGTSSALLISTTVQDNLSIGSGGGIYCYKSTPTLSQSVIRHNDTQSNGGALYATGNASPKLHNMLIYDNFASKNGGGIAVNTASIDIIHCTVADNHAGEGIALFAQNVTLPEQVIVQNSIFCQTNEKPYRMIASDETSIIQVTGSNIVQQSELYEGEGNINEDPKFTDPATENYRIKNGSKCINTGLDLGENALTVDHERLPRPYDHSVDMGAYEWNNSDSVIHIDFYASALSGNPGLTVLFVGYAYSGERTYTDNEFEWNFGTGDLPPNIDAKGKEQTVTFDPVNPLSNDQSREYVVRLTVAGAIKEKVVVIKDAPTASFDANTTGGYAPLQVSFIDTSTYAHTANTRRWSFGDGSESFEPNPIHIYNKPGTYIVKLTITDEKANTDKIVKYNYISVVNPSPKVDFTASRTLGKAPLRVQFFDTTTSYQAVKSWIWTFGDNTTSTNQNPVHTYHTQDEYNVSLTVRDENGSYLESRDNFITVLNNADNIIVCESGGCDFMTIQAAIDSAIDGDTIEVRDGSYDENISFKGKNVRVFSKNGPGATSIIGETGSVVTFDDNENAGAVLQGFTISDGQAPYGAGILIANGASPCISNCTIKNSTAEHSGGGIAIIGGRPNISGVTIKDNYAANGAGLAVLDDASPILHAINIYGNEAYDSGGGIYVFDATIYTREVTVKDNNAAFYGGGVYLNQTTMTLRRVTIERNDAEYGSGLAMRSNKATLIDQCRIIDQDSAVQGGGIYAWDCTSPEIRNTFIVKNNANKGGGIYFHNVETPLVHFSTLADNSANSGDGKAIHVFTDSSDFSPKVTVRNSILWNGGYEIKTEPENMAMVTWSDIADANWLEYTGNISKHPIFSNDTNYKLVQGSPCKNIASTENAPNVDSDGDSRPLGYGYDMGADEATNVPPVAESRTETVLEDTPTYITLVAIDEDGDSLRYEIKTSPLYGRLEGTGGVRTYKPDANFNGTDSFIFNVNDGKYDSNQAQVTINVDSVNDPPEFNITSIQVFENSGTTRIEGWATDINAGANGNANESYQTLTFHVKNVTHPEYYDNLPTISSDGTIVFSLKTNETGTSAVTVQLQDNGYTANNGQNISEEKIFNITIKEVNDPPSFTVNPDYQSMTACEDFSEIIVQEYAENISPGSINEANQQLTFEVTVDYPHLFMEPPKISSTGDLSFVPAPDMTGTAKLTIYLHDDGEPNDVPETSGPRTSTIIIVPVNDRPDFTLGGDIRVDEDSGTYTQDLWIKNAVKGSSDESWQTLTYILTSNRSQLFQSGPTITSSGTLSFTLAPDMHGLATVTVQAQDNGGTAKCCHDYGQMKSCLSGVNISNDKTFQVRVDEINDPPSFDPGDPIVIYQEDAENCDRIDVQWATNVSPGKNEEDQTAFFQTTTDQSSMFDYAPYISSNGMLGFELKPNVFGDANISVYLKDSEGATTDVHQFVLRINEINDPPSFDMSDNLSIMEDAGEQRIDNWAKNINAGPNALDFAQPYNEKDQTITFVVSTPTTNFFLIQPRIEPDGKLIFKTNTNVNGTAIISVYLEDDGTSNGIPDKKQSETKEFTLNVTPVNDPPSFEFDYTHFDFNNEIHIDETETSETLVYSAFAKNIDKGGTNDNEDNQELDFIVENNNTNLFIDQPTIDKYGSLKFTPKPNAAGLAVLSVKLHDTGGTANNGRDTSPSHTFYIKLVAVNDPPSFTLGADPIIVDEDCGLFEATGWITNINPGGGEDEAGQQLTFHVSIDDGIDNLFVQTPKVVFDNDIGSLLFTPKTDMNGQETINIFLTDNLGGKSYARSFIIKVEPKNDPPTFDLHYQKLTIKEDQGEQTYQMAKNILPGPSDESTQSQNLSFDISVSNPDLFTVQPQMTSDGKLTFKAGENQSGDCTVFVKLNDNQPENNISPVKTFILSISDVNDPPSFTMGPNLTIKEGAMAQYKLNWATNISAGAPNEYFQTLTFDLEATDKSLFLELPKLRNDGMLSYTPDPDAFGATQVFVTLKDSGGTQNGGDDTSTPVPFGITILAVNDRPSFTISDDKIRCDEDSGQQQIIGWAENISPGPPNEHNQELTFVVGDIDDDDTNVTNNDDLFDDNGLPTVNSAGILRFKPAKDAFGSATVAIYLRDNGGNENNGFNESYVKHFTVTIDPTNDAPNFEVGSEFITISEDASNQKIDNWAKNISAGADNEDQSLTFLYDITNSQLFEKLPTISEKGTLNFTPADDASGSALMNIWLEDDTKYGPKKQSNQISFRINIQEVNDKPTFNVGPNPTVYEDSGNYLRTEWATDISAGPNEAQSLAFHTSTDNTELFYSAPQLTPDGDLSFTLAPDKWGTATVTLTLNDNGGTENGGRDVSDTAQFTIQVETVNDPPYFTIGPDIQVSEGAPLQEKPAWATNINPGPSDESDQVVTFSISVDKPQLFEVQPTISKEGRLTFKPGADASGIATVTVFALDNGGIANGGINKSENKTFTITIEGSNDPPTFETSEDPTVPEDSGEQTIHQWAKNISAGGPGEENQVLTFILTVDDPSLFSHQPAISSDGTLTFTPREDQSGKTNIRVYLMDDGPGTNVSEEKSFNIDITQVNDPPSFARGANLIIYEDRGEQSIPNWATNISVGPFNEAGQTAEFKVLPDDPSFFAKGPYISEDGKLTYTPGLNRNGDVNITVYLEDNGGRENGGENTSEPQEFNITIIGINDAPSFDLQGSMHSVKEDTGRQVVSNWATNISTGALDEAGQNVVFRISHESESLFSEQPSISPNGVLTFTPKPNASGEAKILVYLEDNGGTANGGENVSGTKEFIIDIIGINDPPSFNKGDNVIVAEDSGPKVIPNWATKISPGAVSEAGQELTFSLVVSDPGLFSYQPEISKVGTLTFTPAPNASGKAYIDVTLKDNGGIAYGGDFTSDPQQFEIEISPANDKPTFTIGPNEEVLEGTGTRIVPQWAKNISAGSDDEQDQNIEFKLTVSNPDFFVRLPDVNNDGTLHYELKDNMSGVISVIIYLEDDGPSTPPNQNKSDETSFKITVLSVNDPPTFDKGQNIYVAEDVGEQRFENWAKNISAGAPDESGQILSFNITTDNDDLFATYPTISVTTGTLVFKPKPNMNGLANVNLRLDDNGGDTNGGNSSSTVQVFTISVYAVNDQPTFLKGSDQLIMEDAGEQNIIGWAKDISPGPENEFDQLLTFHVTPDNPSLFAIPPEVDITGKLTYTPKNDVFGSTLVSVYLQDNGGLQNGGNNTSAMYQFTIRIDSVNDAPSFTPGSGMTVIKSSGLNSYANWATNIIPGPPNESGQSVEFHTVISGDNAIFTQNPAVSPTGTLSFVLSSGRYGSATVSLYLEDDGGTLNGGINRSNTVSFNITVINANAPPIFAKGQDQSVPEDCGEVSIPNWATGIDPGAPDEWSQTVTFHASTNYQDLFSVLPAVTPEGTLTFAPSPNLFGEATVTLNLQDDGGTANGGNDTSNDQTFLIEIYSVNDRPEFRMENEYTSNEDDDTQFVANWAYDIKAGPDNESSQALSFLVTTEQPEMFDLGPEINPSGALKFRSSPNVNGEAIVTVRLQDDGGTENGGQNTSHDKHFKITLQPRNDAPVNVAQPFITGIPQLGQILTGHEGQWNDSIDMTPGTLIFIYQWQKATDAYGSNLQSLPGETQENLTINATTGPYIRFKVTAWDDGEGIPANLSSEAFSRFVAIGKEIADVDGDGQVDLSDAIMTIQALSGIPPQKPMVNGDINGDGKIGLADIIYVLVLLTR